MTVLSKEYENQGGQESVLPSCFSKLLGLYLEQLREPAEDFFSCFDNPKCWDSYSKKIRMSAKNIFQQYKEEVRKLKVKKEVKFNMNNRKIEFSEEEEEECLQIGTESTISRDSNPFVIESLGYQVLERISMISSLEQLGMNSLNPTTALRLAQSGREIRKKLLPFAQEESITLVLGSEGKVRIKKYEEELFHLIMYLAPLVTPCFLMIPD